MASELLPVPMTPDDWRWVTTLLKEHGVDPSTASVGLYRLIAAWNRRAPGPEAEHMGLRQVQEQQREWVRHNFGERPVWMPVMGCAEEVGELCHAVLKRAQGIRGTKVEHDAAIRDALADIIIFACDVATAEGFDLESEVVATWERVRKRDWKADPVAAGESPSPEPAAEPSTDPGKCQYLVILPDGSGRCRHPDRLVDGCMICLADPEHCRMYKPMPPTGTAAGAREAWAKRQEAGK